MASYLDAIRQRDIEGHAFRAPVSPTELAAAQDRRWLLATVDALAAVVNEAGRKGHHMQGCAAWYDNDRARCSCVLSLALARLATPAPEGETNG
jgi:hypothetical protein